MKHGLPSIWDTQPELLDNLRALFAQGYSAAKAAEALGHGISRSSVISKSRRCGLRIDGQKRKPSVVNPSGPAYRGEPRVSRPRSTFSFRSGKRSASSLPLLAPSGSDPLGPIEDIVNMGQCKYIHGDVQVSGWRMCGHETGSPGDPWCAFHKTRVFQKPRQEVEAV